MAGLSGARLQFRPRTTPPQQIPAPAPGIHSLGLQKDRDGLLYVPDNPKASSPFALIMMLHGAGGRAQNSMSDGNFKKFADRTGTLLFAPDSRAITWDVIIGNYGPDVQFIDQSLQLIDSKFNLDPNRLTVSGFSDGASYALSLGLANGDLFSHVMAFSPGFMAPPERRGSPAVFISHGLHDHVLAIDYCSRRIVPRLRDLNYSVTYREFDGEHTMPDIVSNEALEWLSQSPGMEALEEAPRENTLRDLEGP